MKEALEKKTDEQLQDIKGTLRTVLTEVEEELRRRKRKRKRALERERKHEFLS